MAEFAYNNAEHSSTKRSPFIINTGNNQKFNIQHPKENNSPVVTKFTKSMENLQKLVQEELLRATERHKRFADQKRSELPSIRIGDYVWLSKKNIKTTRPCEKLDFKRLGPFKVMSQVNPVAYKLELADSIKIHNVFHVSLLEPYFPNSIEGRTLPPPPPIEVRDELEYEVEKILDSQIRRKKLYYLVDWKGYGVAERT